jgi:hypothetical protein
MKIERAAQHGVRHGILCPGLRHEALHNKKRRRERAGSNASFAEVHYLSRPHESIYEF